MSAPGIALPGPLFVFLAAMGVALISYLLHRWRVLSGLVAGTGCLALSWIIAQMRFVEPSDAFAAIGFPWGDQIAGRTLFLGQSWGFLGHAWAFDVTNLGVLTFVLAAGGLAFLIGLAASQGWSFHAFGMAVIAVLSLAVTSQHYVFALLFLWLAANLSAFVLAGGRPGETTGALRYLAFTSIAMVPLLTMPAFLDPTLASDSPTAFVMPKLIYDVPLPGDALLTASSLLVIGFGLLLMMVPFHGQLVAISATSAPMVSAFMFSTFLPIALYLFLRVGETYPALLGDGFVFAVSRLAGIAAVVVGGLAALGQKRWGSLVGYATLVDWGGGLIALGLGTADGVATAASMLAWRALSLLAVGAGWTVIYRLVGQKDDTVSCAGMLRRRPISVLTAFLGLLSLSAFPFTAGAAGRWPLIAYLLPSDGIAAWALILGSVGVAAGTVFVLWPCLGAPPSTTQEKGVQVVWDTIWALLALTLLGWLFLHPQPWLDLTRRLASGFSIPLL